MWVHIRGALYICSGRIEASFLVSLYRHRKTIKSHQNNRDETKMRLVTKVHNVIYTAALNTVINYKNID